MVNYIKPKHPTRAYILWDGRWRHVHILGLYEQQSVFGEAEKLFEFKLSNKSKDTLTAPIDRFKRKKPTPRAQSREGA